MAELGQEPSATIRIACHFVLHAEALAFDDDGVGVVQNAVKDSGGQGAVAVEDLRPVFAEGRGISRLGATGSTEVQLGGSSPTLTRGRTRRGTSESHWLDFVVR